MYIIVISLIIMHCLWSCGALRRTTNMQTPASHSACSRRLSPLVSGNALRVHQGDGREVR